MFVLGTGIGLCMQVLTIAVQNTVEYADLGPRRPASPSSVRWAVPSAPPSSARSTPTPSRPTSRTGSRRRRSRAAWTRPRPGGHQPGGPAPVAVGRGRPDHRRLRRHDPDRLPVDRAGRDPRVPGRPVPQAGRAARNGDRRRGRSRRGLRHAEPRDPREAAREAPSAGWCGNSPDIRLRNVAGCPGCELDVARLWALLQIYRHNQAFGTADLTYDRRQAAHPVRGDRTDLRPARRDRLRAAHGRPARG